MKAQKLAVLLWLVQAKYDTKFRLIVYVWSGNLRCRKVIAGSLIPVEIAAVSNVLMLPDK